MLVILLYFMKTLSSTFTTRGGIRNMMVSSRSGLPLVNTSICIATRSLGGTKDTRAAVKIVASISNRFSVTVPTKVAHFFYDCIKCSMLRIGLIPKGRRCRVALRTSSRVLSTIIIANCRAIRHHGLATTMSGLSVSSRAVNTMGDVSRTLTKRVTKLSIDPASNTPNTPTGVHVHNATSLGNARSPL